MIVEVLFTLVYDASRTGVTYKDRHMTIVIRF